MWTRLAKRPEAARLFDEAMQSLIEAEWVYRGQSLPVRKRDDQVAMANCERGGRYDQSAIRSMRELRDGALNLARVTRLSSAGANQVRTGHKSQDRKSARVDDPAGGAHPCQ